MGRKDSASEQVVVLDNLSRGQRVAVPVDVPFYRGVVSDRAVVAHRARASIETISNTVWAW